MKKKTPPFKPEDEEREFWSKTNPTEFVDWDAAKRVVLPNLKPPQKTILPSALMKNYDPRKTSDPQLLV